MVRPPMACGFHPRWRISFNKHFPCQPRALGIESRSPAIDVVIARAARGELELAQLERLVGEQAKQVLARGSHEILRYHGESPVCGYSNARPLGGAALAALRLSPTIEGFSPRGAFTSRVVSETFQTLPPPQLPQPRNSPP